MKILKKILDAFKKTDNIGGRKQRASSVLESESLSEKCKFYKRRQAETFKYYHLFNTRNNNKKYLSTETYT